MSYASTLVARATPLRSVISPRSAASGAAEVAVLLGLGRVRARVDGLHLEQPHDEGEHHQRQPEADQAQPGAGAAEPDACAAPGRGRRGGPAAGRRGGARRRRPPGVRPRAGVRALPGRRHCRAARAVPCRTTAGACRGGGVERRGVTGCGVEAGCSGRRHQGGRVRAGRCGGPRERRVTVPSGLRKAGLPPGTMPSSRARRWRASGAE